MIPIANAQDQDHRGFALVLTATPPPAGEARFLYRDDIAIRSMPT
jgi:hypothetical protein